MGKEEQTHPPWSPAQRGKQKYREIYIYQARLNHRAARQTWHGKSQISHYISISISYTNTTNTTSISHSSNPESRIGYLSGWIMTIIDVLGVTVHISGWITIYFIWLIFLILMAELCYHIDICWHSSLFTRKITSYWFSQVPRQFDKTITRLPSYLIFFLVGGHLRVFLSSMLISKFILWASLQSVLATKIKVEDGRVKNA